MLWWLFRFVVPSLSVLCLAQAANMYSTLITAGCRMQGISSRCNGQDIFRVSEEENPREKELSLVPGSQTVAMMSCPGNRMSQNNRSRTGTLKEHAFVPRSSKSEEIDSWKEKAAAGERLPLHSRIQLT